MTSSYQAAIGSFVLSQSAKMQGRVATVCCRAERGQAPPYQRQGRAALQRVRTPLSAAYRVRDTNVGLVAVSIRFARALTRAREALPRLPKVVAESNRLSAIQLVSERLQSCLGSLKMEGRWVHESIFCKNAQLEAANGTGSWY